MAGIPSPDIPAIWCYLIVFVVGGFVAWSKVRDLANYPDRWAFAATYQLLFIHWALPVLLFWFLDYISVVQDTSLFAAVVVAVGYGQIFSGSVQGISLPGQVASLWTPFQAWVRAVADRIATKQKKYRDNFDRRTQRHIAYDRAHLESLEKLVWVQILPSAGLYAQLQAVPRNATLERTRALWQALREAEPENYGYLLYKEKIISPLLYFRWFNKGRARAVPIVIGAITAAVLAAAVAVQVRSQLQNRDGPLQLVEYRYFQWRATRQNSSQWDRYRTYRYFHQALEDAGQQEWDPDRLQAFTRSLVEPVASRLCFQDISTEQANSILRMLIGLHSPQFDNAVIPQLLDCLRTRNADVRMRIHLALQGFQRADYPNPNPPIPADLMGWVPKSDEAVEKVESCVSAWKGWWAAQQGSDSTPIQCEGNHLQENTARTNPLPVHSP